MNRSIVLTAGAFVLVAAAGMALIRGLASGTEGGWNVAPTAEAWADTPGTVLQDGLGNGNFLTDYLAEKIRQLAARPGSADWFKGVLGLLALALYLYAIPKWGYGGVIRRIKEGEPTDTRAYLVFGASSASAAANAVIDQSFVPALCMALLGSYALYTAWLNRRLRRKIARERATAKDENGNDWSFEEQAFETLGAHTACSLWTRDGKVRRWSSGMRQILGYGQEEMRSMPDPINALYGYDPEAEAHARGQLETLFSGENGASYRRLFAPKAKSGKIQSLEFLTVLLKDERGEAKGRISIVLGGENAAAMIG